MTWTRDNMEELRDGVEKVKDLRNEKQKKRLAEDSKDAGRCKRHSGKVAKSIPNKHSRWIP